MTENELDALLSAPLPSVADDGFTSRIAARLSRSEFRFEALQWTAIAAGSLAIAVSVPWGSLPLLVEKFTVAGTVMPLAFACGALLITQWTARWLPE
jgi:hypothetical protein